MGVQIFFMEPALNVCCRPKAAIQSGWKS